MNTNTHKPHYLIKPVKNEVMRSIKKDNPSSTEVVQSFQLGKNEVVPTISKTNSKKLISN